MSHDCAVISGCVLCEAERVAANRRARKTAFRKRKYGPRYFMQWWNLAYHVRMRDPQSRKLYEMQP